MIVPPKSSRVNVRVIRNPPRLPIHWSSEESPAGRQLNQGEAAQVRGGSFFGSGQLPGRAWRDVTAKGWVMRWIGGSSFGSG